MYLKPSWCCLISVRIVQVCRPITHGRAKFILANFWTPITAAWGLLDYRGSIMHALRQGQLARHPGLLLLSIVYRSPRSAAGLTHDELDANVSTYWETGTRGTARLSVRRWTPHFLTRTTGHLLDPCSLPTFPYNPLHITFEKVSKVQTWRCSTSRVWLLEPALRYVRGWWTKLDPH